MAAVYVNLYGILSVEDAVARLEAGYAGLRGQLRSLIEGLIRTLRPTVSVPVLALSPAAGRRVLVAFDEFQEALTPRVPLDGLMRSVIEQHIDEAAYVFAGSDPGMMARLFSDRERPFFGQARPISLGPLRDDDLAVHLAERYAAAGRSVDEVLGLILDTSRGHPQRAMLLAHHLFELVSRSEEATETHFLDALERVRDELREAFERLWRAFDDGGRRSLAAVAVGDGHPTRAAALAAGDVARTTAVDALARLSDAGHLHREEGERWVFVDPLFADWVTSGRAAT